MREIREVIFRGKRTDNGKWVKGYLYITHIGSHEIGSYDAEINIERLTFDVIPETVGQYTGLTDKNGNKIFEGDIVKRVPDGERAVISWLKYYACFGLSFDGWCCGFDNYDDNLPSDFEIIGNIHDNPELLVST